MDQTSILRSGVQGILRGRVGRIILIFEGEVKNSMLRVEMPIYRADGASY